jgi:hypothetical protein
MCVCVYACARLDLALPRHQKLIKRVGGTQGLPGVADLWRGVAWLPRTGSFPAGPTCPSSRDLAHFQRLCQC